MHSVTLLSLRPFYARYGDLIADFLSLNRYPQAYHDWIFTWLVNECLLRADPNIRFIVGQHQDDYDRVGRTILATIPDSVYLMREILEASGITFRKELPIKTAVTYDSLILMKCWSHYEVS